VVGLRGAWVAVLSAVLCAGVLVACDDDPEPKVGDPTTAPPSTSSSAPTSPSTTAPTTTAPVMPGEAGQQTDGGAEAFVRFYVDVFNFSQSTGDTTTLAEISDKACAACQAYVSSIDDVFANGGSVDGGELTIGELRKLPLDYGAEWAGFAKGRSAPQVIHHGDGSDEEHAGSQLFLYAYLDWNGNAWRMRLIKTPTPA